MQGSGDKEAGGDQAAAGGDGRRKRRASGFFVKALPRNGRGALSVLSFLRHRAGCGGDPIFGGKL